MAHFSFGGNIQNINNCNFFQVHEEEVSFHYKDFIVNIIKIIFSLDV